MENIFSEIGSKEDCATNHLLPTKRDLSRLMGMNRVADGLIYLPQEEVLCVCVCVCGRFTVFAKGK